jgi:hypothetical protein
MSEAGQLAQRHRGRKRDAGRPEPCPADAEWNSVLLATSLPIGIGLVTHPSAIGRPGDFLESTAGK